MNSHLTDGQLRAAIDGELDGSEFHHLQSCTDCQSRQRVLQAQVERTGRALAFLAPQESKSEPSVQASLKDFYARKLPQKETSMFKRFLSYPTVRFAAVAILLLALIISIPATRALADEVLNLFRVQQVTVLPVDFTGLQQLTGNGTLGKQVSELISDSITMKEKPGDPVDAVDAADASAKAGFSVRLPQDVAASRLSVTNETAFDFTIDRAKAQALLDEAGRSDLMLPDSVDGAVVSVTVPASIRADYGSCPDPTSDDSDQQGSMGRQYPDCVILSEIPSPTVNAPANVDVAQLAQISLEFTGMTSDEAATFTSTVDWTSTLVVPIPKNAATYKQVSVDGVTGTLIQRPSDDAPQFVLLWVKDGIVYSIGGFGTNSQQALDMANTLP